MGAGVAGVEALDVRVSSEERPPQAQPMMMAMSAGVVVLEEFGLLGGLTGGDDARTGWCDRRRR